ncbi:hypothetical protein DFP72DRAFT_853888 [Ephemerocybe angulata]|uniref:Uncharacterized protein n=1 Tax=Ephemerocybe angulata TaxID=980116 RepID=A0A8H6LYY2_9AGAR|nr:hypothetical protein DFP72DRAFT_853888 [Tulosesus angulatus]
MDLLLAQALKRGWLGEHTNFGLRFEAVAPSKNKAEDVASDPPVKEEGEAVDSAKKKVPAISWSAMPELTDALLTKIEENEPRRTALGFTKGNSEDGSAGKMTTHHHTTLAKLVLIPHESGLWKDVDPKDLSQAVRYRIVAMHLYSMKQIFNQCREDLKATGNEIVMEGKEDTLTGDLKNIWGVFLSAFSLNTDRVAETCHYYKHMYDLMADSPVYNDQACSNSKDSLDKELDGLLERHSSQKKDDEVIKVDDSDDDESQDGSDDEKEVKKPGRKEVAKKESTSVGGKRKNAMLSQLEVMADADCAACERVVR